MRVGRKETLISQASCVLRAGKCKDDVKTAKTWAELDLAEEINRAAWKKQEKKGESCDGGAGNKE